MIALPTLAAALQNGLGEALQHDPLMALVSLFGAGVLTSLTPCVYPMIPITAGLLAGTTGGPDARRTARPRRRVLGLTLAYITGLALFYALLGMLAGMTGSLFGTVASNPWVRFAVGNLLLVFGLAMLDVIPVPVPRRLMQWAATRGGGSYPAVFVMGAASGIVAAPCGAPAFAAVLTFVATTRSALLGFLYLFVFSLGMTTLLAAVGISSGSLAALPSSGQWLVWVKRGAGILLLAMAEYYFIQAGMVW